MTRTKEQVQEAFGLDELPDDEFMRLLEEVGPGPVIRGVRPVQGSGWTAEEIRQALRQVRGEAGRGEGAAP